MHAVSTIANALQVVMTSVANQLAKTTGAIQREREFNGSSLAQTFVFGWLANPNATMDELAQMAAACGAPVSSQAVSQRFGESLSQFFRSLLEATVGQVVVADPVAIPLLRRFNGVYLQDSTVIGLPDVFQDEYPSCGGGCSGQAGASLKFQVRMNLTNGQLIGPFPEAGRCSDQSSQLQRMPLPAGSLRLADLGYFNLSVLRQLHQDDVYWVSRIQPHTAVFDTDGQRLELLRRLKRSRENAVDLQVLLGSQERLPCRLLAVRCPAEVVRKRIASLEKDAKRRGRSVSQQQRQWCHWTIAVTNTKPEQLTLREAFVLLRARWQIELLFKLWKQHGLVDESRGSDCQRILAEIYAKMIGVVIQHWLIVACAWTYSDRSLVKFANLIRKHAYCIVASLACRISIESAIAQIQECLTSSGRIDTRNAQPSTCQLLLDPDLLDYLYA